ncbi:hypothetical protein CsSME_00045166 [Camellia sinensis var. sinensis]
MHIQKHSYSRQSGRESKARIWHESSKNACAMTRWYPVIIHEINEAVAIWKIGRVSDLGLGAHLGMTHDTCKTY